jgi:Escherichia/Staphylococcus phage prohead protease
MTTERRSVNLVDADVKGRIFRGYAAVFDTPWSDRLTEAAGYVEKVNRGVFRKALGASDNVPLLLEHDQHQLLGTTQSGNVKLREDGRGLLTEATLPDNYLGEYARSLIAAGDLKGMSYGITLDPKKDTMLTRDGNVWTRTIIGVKQLLDVSLTWQPAYQATTVELRTAGFVATPLQELLGGLETQTEDTATESSPDEQGSWWGSEPPAEDPETTTEAFRRRQSYIDMLERGLTDEKG